MSTAAKQVEAAPVATTDAKPGPALVRCEQCGHYAVIWMYGCCKACVQDVEREASAPVGHW